MRWSAARPRWREAHAAARTVISTGALGLAVLAAAAIAIWTSVNHVRLIDAHTIRVGYGIVFAPPPPGSVPALTARQAWAKFSAGERRKVIAPGTTMQLGLLSVPIGPYCGRECDGHPVRDGIAYTVLNRLAYGYSWLAFPHRHLKPRDWVFLDANTGSMIIGTLARQPGPASGY